MLVALCCSCFISKVKQLKTGMSKFDEIIDSFYVPYGKNNLLGRQITNLALKCKRFSFCHSSYIIRIQPVGTLGVIQGIIFNFEIVCFQNLVVTVGWGCVWL